MVPSHGPNVVTLYDEINFNGNYKNLDLSKGCTNISDGWEGESGSIRTYGQCVIIYEKYGCSRAYLSIQLDNLNEHVHQSLKSKGLDQKVHSIELCPLEATKTSKHGADSKWSYPIIAFAVLLLLIGLCIIAAVIKVLLGRRRRHKRVIEILTDEEMEDFFAGCGGNPALEDCSTDLVAYSQPYDNNYEIPKEFLSIDMKSTLSIGEYAIVFKGRVRRPNCLEGCDCDVAVKTVKPFSSVENVRDLLMEIKTMIYVGRHPRIIELIGCCTTNLRKSELFVMIEFCENGNIETFLMKNRICFANIDEHGKTNLKNSNLSFSQGNYSNVKIEPISSTHFNTIHLLQWAMQIAEGMAYLANKKVIHGSLATKNVLLDINFNAKISDLLFSKKHKELTECMLQNLEPVHWRLMSIESLKSLTFSTESDVWAFGVTVWEMFTLGDIPYAGLIWDNNFPTRLSSGYRLSKPIYASSDCYNLMLSCWRELRFERISFSELRFKFQKLLEHYSNLSENY